MGKSTAYSRNNPSANTAATRRRLLVKAAERIVASNRVTVCAMDSELGFKGPVCPVENCYMRSEETGACIAEQAAQAKASSKLMRDAMTIVEIIDTTRNAPDWARFTVVTSLDERYEEFIKEAGLDRGKLQYVLDNNSNFLITMNSVFKSQEVS